MYQVIVVGLKCVQFLRGDILKDIIYFDVYLGIFVF